MTRLNDCTAFLSKHCKIDEYITNFNTLRLSGKKIITQVLHHYGFSFRLKIRIDFVKLDIIMFPISDSLLPIMIIIALIRLESNHILA